LQVIKREKKDLWYLDSGCLRHITGDKSKFAKLELKEEGFVTYGDNNQGRILGSGVISNGVSFNIHNVLLVEGLKHNLISISQLCDKGFKVVFEPNHMMKSKRLTDFKIPYVVLISKFIEHFGVDVEGELEESTSILHHVSTLNMHKMGFTKIGNTSLVEGDNGANIKVGANDHEARTSGGN